MDRLPQARQIVLDADRRVEQDAILGVAPHRARSAPASSPSHRSATATSPARRQLRDWRQRPCSPGAAGGSACPFRLQGQSARRPQAPASDRPGARRRAGPREGRAGRASPSAIAPPGGPTRNGSSASAAPDRRPHIARVICQQVAHHDPFSIGEVVLKTFRFVSTCRARKKKIKSPRRAAGEKPPRAAARSGRS